VVIICHQHLQAFIFFLDDLPHLVVNVVRALDIFPFVMMRLAGLRRARDHRLSFGIVLLRVVTLGAAAATAELLMAQLAIGRRAKWAVSGQDMRDREM